MKPVSIAHEAYFIFTSNYLEFCIKQDADFIRNIIQILKLVASCNLLLLAKINLLTIQFRELAFEHEFMFLLSLLALFALAIEAKYDGVGEEIAILVVEPETHIYTLHLVGNRLALVETDSLVIGGDTTLPVENIHRNLADSLFLLDVDMQYRNYNFLRHTATMYESASRTLFADSVQPFGSLYFRVAF